MNSFRMSLSAWTNSKSRVVLDGKPVFGRS